MIETRGATLLVTALLAALAVVTAGGTAGAAEPAPGQQVPTQELGRGSAPSEP